MTSHYLGGSFYQVQPLAVCSVKPQVILTESLMALHIYVQPAIAKWSAMAVQTFILPNFISLAWDRGQTCPVFNS